MTATFFCVIGGATGDAFPIDIDKGKSVGHLKQAIKNENTDINKNDKWLTGADVKEGVSATTGLEPLGVAQDSLCSVGLSDEDVAGVAGVKMRDPVHVLVVVPEHYNTRAMDVLDVMLPYVLTHAPTTLIKQNIEFKDELCKFYGCYRRKKSWVRCMLLDVAFSQSLVIASHLFRHSNEYLAPMLMKFTDIDDVKNGLLLFKPLKHAFDHFQLSFILNDTKVFRLKLFD